MKQKMCRINGIIDKATMLSNLANSETNSGFKFDVLFEMEKGTYKHFTNNETKFDTMKKFIDASSNKKLELYDKDCLVKEKPTSNSKREKLRM